jgi:hypothetical protein
MKSQSKIQNPKSIHVRIVCPGEMDLLSVWREILVGSASVKIDSWLQATITLIQNASSSRSKQDAIATIPRLSS